jgi:hypothetical protein
MDELEKDLIPDQEKGMQSNTESEKECDSVEAAYELYELAKSRLLQPNHWHEYAGKATAEFQLTDEKGQPFNGPVEKGFHFRIDIPGPGSGTGNGYDWVKVESVEEKNLNDENLFKIQVRPATNPLNNKPDVAHFFSDEATSSFMISRKGMKVKAAVYGRNEKPNTGAESLTDKARNAAVATGAVTGFAKLQWKSLVNGLIKR